jgi:UDP-N-acetylmuramoyl-tripeptide--D-alanyl-D-alanine ligase
MITVREIVEALRPQQIVATGAATRFRHAVVDSRKAGRGDLFVALKGERVDGHEFVANAARMGATGSIVARALDVPIAQYVVPDPLTALQELARQRRKARPRLKVIGVTGSVGKTTTKEIIAGVLATKYPVLKSEGNLNSEIGLPLVLLEATNRHRRAVLEMGMWAPGEIALLCEIAQPEIGVVTMVGPVHQERLGTIEAIAWEKSQLPASLPGYGVAVLNADDARVMAMSERTAAHVITFGLAETADVRAENVQSHGLAGVNFTLMHGDERAPVYSKLPGRAMVHNALAAAAVGVVDGLPLADVAAAITALPRASRMCVHRGRGGSTIIDDTYNASPASMLAALDLLGESAGRKIAVLGDMRELGDAETGGHADVGRRAAEIADVVFAVGELGRMIGEAALAAGHRDVRVVATKDGIAPELALQLTAGDVVLLKASRALELETLVEELREDA